MTSRADRVFALLLRAYPAQPRARCGIAMRHAFSCELQAARAKGTRAVLTFSQERLVAGLVGCGVVLGAFYRRGHRRSCARCFTGSSRATR